MPDLKSGVVVRTYADGSADISITGPGGTLTLDVSPDGPTIAIKDVERTQRRGGADMFKIVAALEANGQLKGWFAKPGEGPEKDTIVWFPARKSHARKRRTRPRPPDTTREKVT